MASTRGPIGKRSETRIRRNPAKDAGITTAPGAENVVMPEPNDEWVDWVWEWYVSLAESGQARYYEPSDWMVAYTMAEWMNDLQQDHYLGMRDAGRGEQEVVYGRKPMNAGEISAFLKANAVLGATEGDRRRLGIELQRGDAGEPSQTSGQSARARAAERLGLTVHEGGAS